MPPPEKTRARAQARTWSSRPSSGVQRGSCNAPRLCISWIADTGSLALSVACTNSWPGAPMSRPWPGSAPPSVSASSAPGAKRAWLTPYPASDMASAAAVLSCCCCWGQLLLRCRWGQLLLGWKAAPTFNAAAAAAAPQLMR